MDRLIGVAEAERQEIDRQEAERVELRERRERRERAPALSLPEPEDAFDEIYGEIVDAG